MNDDAIDSPACELVHGQERAPARTDHRRGDGLVRCQLVARAALTAARKLDMYRLLASHFENVAPEQFADDLEGKDWVVLVEEGPRLVGFSTLVSFRIRWEGRTLRVVYSGDTIVDPCAWRSTAFLRGWIATVRRLAGASPQTPLYWLLLVSGFRTYRLLPVLFREFFPRFDTATPPRTQALIDHLAWGRFGDRYDRAAGVVRFTRPQVLRESLRRISPSRLGDPHVAYFTDRNPGHESGDELVCLSDLSRQNLTRAGLRMDGGEGGCRMAP